MVPKISMLFYMTKGALVLCKGHSQKTLDDPMGLVPSETPQMEEEAVDLKCTRVWTTSAGFAVVSVSWNQPSTDSQQAVGDLSFRTARNWIWLHCR